MKIGDVSFWYADIGLPETRRAALAGDTAVDVAIIGAGFTGLWTAWYLMQARPDLNVLVIEKEFAGFGASRGMNSNRVVPTRNPAGSWAWRVSQARWESRSVKVRAVLATREKWARGAFV